jgi:sulfite reductase (ferredoxin)
LRSPADERGGIRPSGEELRLPEFLVDDSPGIAPPPPDEALDLTGIRCPLNSSEALIRLEFMEEGEHLELTIDDGPPRENVPLTLTQEGHAVVEIRRSGSQWVLLVRRGPDV